MLNLPNKPRITTEPRRDDYGAAFTLRWRRPWNKMSIEERAAVLSDAADYLETIAGQMRTEADEL